jgi:hypothetical protein
VGAYDGGGQRWVDAVTAAGNTEDFIPVEVDRSAAESVVGGCTSLCYPRSVTLEVGYHQMTSRFKRIVYVNLVLADFDKNATASDYKLNLCECPACCVTQLYGRPRLTAFVPMACTSWTPHCSKAALTPFPNAPSTPPHTVYYALDYWQLIVSFAFSSRVFMVLFICIGVGTLMASMAFWLVVRLTTHLQKPPVLRFVGYFSLIAPPAFAGSILGLVPGTIVTFLIYMLLKGYTLKGDGSYPSNGYWILDQYVLHWYDKTLDPNVVEGGRRGRFGLAFITLGAMSLFAGARFFVPPRESKREKELAEKRTKVSQWWRTC